jgi:hypothetical protein
MIKVIMFTVISTAIKNNTEGMQYYIKSIFSGIEDISLETPDKIKLKGYIIHNSTESKSPLLIYFGGNNEPSTTFLFEKF